MADDGTDLRLVDSNNNQQHCLHGLDLLFVTWSVLQTAINHGEIIVGHKPSYLGLYMHLFRDIKSVYRFITFKKNWWARKFNNISFLKHSKPYYIVCYLHVTPKTRLNA